LFEEGWGSVDFGTEWWEGPLLEVLINHASLVVCRRVSSTEDIVRFFLAETLNGGIRAGALDASGFKVEIVSCMTVPLMLALCLNKQAVHHENVWKSECIDALLYLGILWRRRCNWCLVLAVPNFIIILPEVLLRSQIAKCQ
jgi:hypothetical protein